MSWQCLGRNLGQTAERRDGARIGSVFYRSCLISSHVSCRCLRPIHCLFRRSSCAQECRTRRRVLCLSWGRYHGGRRPSSDDSLHSPTVIPPSALDKRSIMKRYHRRRTCSHTSPRRSPTMVTLHDTGFVECRWWNDG